MTDLLATHRALLERFRRSMNLVGPGPVDAHFEDCRLALEPLRPTGRWADLGSGAGFPGLVFAAMFPEVALDLVESRAKRCWFLSRVLADADLGDRAPIRVLRARIEDLPQSVRYDGVLARALAKPPAVLDHARALLVPGGLAVLLLNADQPVPEAEGFTVTATHPYESSGKPRKTLVFRFGG